MGFVAATIWHVSQTFQKSWIIILIIFIGTWRGWGLWYRSLFTHDEGHALLNARTYRSVIAWVLKGGPWRGAAGLDALRDSLHRGGGTLYSAGKSGYSVILALSGLPLNVSADQGLLLD